MTSNKPYTNATFTRRVDHEAGRHRPPQSASEPLQCETCGAVYFHKRWVTGKEMRSRKPDAAMRPPTLTICPACKQQEGLPRGFLHVRGAFMEGHQHEIDRLLDNEARRAGEDNPLARVMGQETNEDGEIVIATTTEHLAQRLGHALNKAFKGDVHYDFSHENKVARVYWERD